MASLKLVWFLCGYLISLSSVSSLECNIKYCRNGECTGDENRQCSAGLQCRTLTYNFERSGGLMLQNECSSLCNQEEYCRELAERYKKYNPIINCALRCCDTDLCNASAKDKGSSQTTVLDNKKLSKEIKEFKEMLEKVEKAHKN